jgi:hypothetical protein
MRGKAAVAVTLVPLAALTIAPGVYAQAEGRRAVNLFSVLREPQGVEDRLPDWFVSDRAIAYLGLDAATSREAFVDDGWRYLVAVAHPRGTREEAVCLAQVQASPRRPIRYRLTGQIPGVLHCAPLHLFERSFHASLANWRRADLKVFDVVGLIPDGFGQADIGDRRAGVERNVVIIKDAWTPPPIADPAKPVAVEATGTAGRRLAIAPNGRVTGAPEFDTVLIPSAPPPGPFRRIQDDFALLRRPARKGDAIPAWIAADPDVRSRGVALQSARRALDTPTRRIFLAASRHAMPLNMTVSAFPVADDRDPYPDAVCLIDVWIARVRPPSYVDGARAAITCGTSESLSRGVIAAPADPDKATHSRMTSAIGAAPDGFTKVLGAGRSHRVRDNVFFVPKIRITDALVAVGPAGRRRFPVQDSPPPSGTLRVGAAPVVRWRLPRPTS